MARRNSLKREGKSPEQNVSQTLFQVIRRLSVLPLMDKSEWSIYSTKSSPTVSNLIIKWNKLSKLLSFSRFDLIVCSWIVTIIQTYISKYIESFGVSDKTFWKDINLKDSNTLALNILWNFQVIFSKISSQFKPYKIQHDPLDEKE